MNAASTVQSAMIALVVNVPLLNDPPHVPPTLALYPASADTMNVVVVPCAIDCTMRGEIDPLIPALGLTLKNTVLHDVAPAVVDVVPAGHTVCEIAPALATKKPGCARPHEDCPALAWNEPAVQGVCAVALDPATKLPGDAGLHEVALLLAWNVPGEQAVCELAPAPATKLPGCAASHCTAPLFAWNVPDKHAVCAIAPAIATKLPGCA